MKFLTALLCLFLTACGGGGGGGSSEPDAQASGIQSMTLKYAGTEPYLEHCNGNKRTLLVYFHSWNADEYEVWQQKEILALPDACIISANLNAPGNAPSCGSDDAIARATAVIQQAKAEHLPAQTVAMGISGGGYMALMMAGKTSLFQKAIIWVPIYDLAQWYGEQPARQAQLETCFGKAPVDLNDPDYLARSPKGVLDSAAVPHVIVNVGKKDSVTPPVHGINAANHLKAACPSCNIELIEHDIGHEYLPDVGLQQLARL